LHGKYVEYDHTGIISEEKFYDHGSLEGKYSSYYKNGSLQSEYMYVNDKRHGESASYYQNGVAETKQQYAAGKKHGEGLMYSESGILLSKATYSNGEKDGEAFNYYEDGKLEGEEHYIKGKLEGTSRWYYKNGRLSSVEQYTDNELKSFELFNEDGTPDTVSEGPGDGPQFPGGMSGMKRYLADNIRYPQNAMELGISGKVYLTFVIAIDGKVTNVVVKRGIIDCPECDAEARRVISQMPDWIPGKTHNRWIDAHYNLPIGFIME
jgi:TonB family protein